MNIIDEFRRVTEEMAIARSNVHRANRVLAKFIWGNFPKDLTGVGYSDIKVQNNVNILDLAESLYQRDKYIANRDMAEAEYEELETQLEELEKAINNLGDIEKKAMMLRIKGYSNRQIADELHYSLRGVEEIFKRARKKAKECGANVVEDVVI